METERILLRPWREGDAETLFKYASDPEVGPCAGWPPHKSVEESLKIIRTVFSAEGMWAVIWKETGEAIGCVGYLLATASNLKIAEDHAEVGYWIARPYWGKDICTEALRMVIDYCFNEKGFTVLWGSYFPSNPASGRVMEKCGFGDTGEETLCPNLEVGSDRPVRVMKIKNMISMKTKNFAKKALVMVAMMFMFVMNAQAQQKRLMEFQTVMAINETTYKNCLKEGKYKEAITSLTTLINILDTTTIHKDTDVPENLIKESKGMYQYDMACCYALTGQKKQALQVLEKSVNNGYKNYNNMLNDNDLKTLRKDKKYKALLEIVKDRQPLSVLKKAGPYAKDSVKKDNPFHYQPKESKNLCMVREYFKLDSVAGQGDEMSKIINLLHFVHDNMPHDGNHRAFAEMDAIDLYNYVKTTGKGVNCRQLAISLCEMYLALGIRARYVTCLPADPNDHECHVINSVWSNQLQKWIWIDPTMDAWVMDENGNMLGIAEVRERLRNGLPLVVCETANWNHQNQQTKEYYLDYYMAKNLYFFACKKISRFNSESDYRENPSDNDFVLFPTGYSSPNWKGCDTTTDSDLFWAKPEY